MKCIRFVQLEWWKTQRFVWEEKAPETTPPPPVEVAAGADAPAAPEKPAPTVADAAKEPAENRKEAWKDINAGMKALLALGEVADKEKDPIEKQRAIRQFLDKPDMRTKLTAIVSASDFGIDAGTPEAKELIKKQDEALNTINGMKEDKDFMTAVQKVYESGDTNGETLFIIFNVQLNEGEKKEFLEKQDYFDKDTQKIDLKKFEKNYTPSAMERAIAASVIGKGEIEQMNLTPEEAKRYNTLIDVRERIQNIQKKDEADDKKESWEVTLERFGELLAKIEALVNKIMEKWDKKKPGETPKGPEKPPEKSAERKWTMPARGEISNKAGTIEIKTERHAPVRAMEGGKITLKSPNSITVKQTDGREVVYKNITSTLKQYAEIKAGDPLGKVQGKVLVLQAFSGDGDKRQAVALNEGFFEHGTEEAAPAQEKKTEKKLTKAQLEKAVARLEKRAKTMDEKAGKAMAKWNQTKTEADLKEADKLNAQVDKIKKRAERMREDAKKATA